MKKVFLLATLLTLGACAIVPAGGGHYYSYGGQTYQVYPRYENGRTAYYYHDNRPVPREHWGNVYRRG